MPKTLEEYLQTLMGKLDYKPTIDLGDPDDFGLGILFWRGITAVVVTNDTGRIVLWNPAARSIFGWTEEEAVGQNVDILVPQEDKVEHHLAIGKWRLGEGSGLVDSNQTRRLQAITKEGRNIIVDLLLSSLHRHSDGETYLMALMRDVTNLVQYEETVLEHVPHDEVYHEVIEPIVDDKAVHSQEIRDEIKETLSKDMPL